MREAKLAASVFGVITACLIGGGAVAYNAAPQVSTRDNFEIVEPAYNGMTLTAETSEENKTAITEPAKEKTETNDKTAKGSGNRPHAVRLSYIAASADTATAAVSVAATFQSVTETEPRTTIQAASAADWYMPQRRIRQKITTISGQNPKQQRLIRNPKQ